MKRKFRIILAVIIGSSVSDPYRIARPVVEDTG